MTEILDYRVLLPAVVRCKKDGEEIDVLVYIDHTKKTCIVTEGGFPDNMGKLIYSHIQAGNRPITVPKPPSEGFDQLKPETYLKDQNG